MKSGSAAVQHLSERTLFLSFFISPGSAEALVRWGGKIKYLLMVYFLSTFVPKNYENRFMYVRVIARQISDIFWGHTIDAEIKHKTIQWKLTVLKVGW